MKFKLIVEADSQGELAEFLASGGSSKPDYKKRKKSKISTYEDMDNPEERVYNIARDYIFYTRGGNPERLKAHVTKISGFEEKRVGELLDSLVSRDYLDMDKKQNKVFIPKEHAKQKPEFSEAMFISGEERVG